MRQATGGSNTGGQTGIYLTQQGMPPQTFTNKTSTTVNLTQYISGGNAPYTFTMQGLTTPAFLSISLSSAGVITYARNFGVGVPSPAPPNNINVGKLTFKVTDSSGVTATLSADILMNFKRIFVSKDGVPDANNANWAGVQSYNYSACNSGSGVDKGNCRCVTAAQGVGLPNPQKYRVILSQSSGPAVHAKCNLIGQVNSSCSPVTNDGGPWYNMANQLVATDMSTTAGVGILASSGSLPNPIQFQEDAADAGGALVWTGSNPGGTSSASDCSNWLSTGISGTQGTSNNPNMASGWLQAGAVIGTTVGNRLYCAEMD